MNIFNSVFMDSLFLMKISMHISGISFNVSLSEIRIFPSKSKKASAILLLISLLTISSKRLSTLFVFSHLLLCFEKIFQFCFSESC